VQHGTCGISMEDVSKLVAHGMNKVNFGEAFRFNYIKYFNELTDTMEHQWHAWRIMREVKNLIKQDMKEIIRAVGSEGKAL
jgi:fructose/tagatose bisphosphate aldolase